MFAGSNRDRPLQLVILALTMASVFSLIFQVGIVYALNVQIQNGLGFVQLPLPLPGPLSRHINSQPRLLNETQQAAVHSFTAANGTIQKTPLSADVIIPNQYIIILKSSAGSDSLSLADKVKNSLADKIRNSVADKIKKMGASIIFTNKFASDGFTIKISNAKALEEIKQDPNVAFIEQDKIVHINSQILPTGVKRVGADLSSTIAGNGFGDVDADIAILDTGISLSHPDLNLYRQQTFVTGTTSADDDNGHGTHVAGIAAAKDNSVGIVGVAPGARLWAVKVLDKDGAGAISTIIKGIDYITQHANEIDVANLSFGCECSSAALDAAINSSVQAGITYVVSAGNDHKEASTFSPANDPNVLAVSAIADSDGKCGGFGAATNHGSDDTLADFSNYGKAVSIAAPGVNILSTYKDNSYTTLSGTSMAAPFVAGAAALYKASHKSSSPFEVRNALLSAGSIPSTICDGDGHGYFAGDPDGIHEPFLYVKAF
jgi:subtilisin family serine protease